MISGEGIIDVRESKPNFAEALEETPMVEDTPDGWQRNYEANLDLMRKNWERLDNTRVEVDGGFSVQYIKDGHTWLVTFTAEHYTETLVEES